jgi:mRNA interferase RelE/StbE
MKWIVAYSSDAFDDLHHLSHSQQIMVLKAIRKVSVNPLPQNEGGYGKPLGIYSTTQLSEYLKIKLRKPGIRIVYRLINTKKEMRIVIISVRENEKVYFLLQERIKQDRI